MTSSWHDPSPLSGLPDTPAPAADVVASWAAPGNTTRPGNPFLPAAATPDPDRDQDPDAGPSGPPDRSDTPDAGPDATAVEPATSNVEPAATPAAATPSPLAGMFGPAPTTDPGPPPPTAPADTAAAVTPQPAPQPATPPDVAARPNPPAATPPAGSQPPGPPPATAPAASAPSPNPPPAATAGPSPLQPRSAPPRPLPDAGQQRVYAHNRGHNTPAVTGDLLDTVKQIAARLAEDPFVAARINNGEITLTNDRAEEADAIAFLTTQVMPRLPDLHLPVMDEGRFKAVMQRLYDEIVGLGPLGPLWRDKTVTEILVDGPDHIYVERGGDLVDTDITFANKQDVQSIARSLATIVAGRSLSRSTPIVGGELPGARVQFVYEPLVKSGVAISIRKFSDLLGSHKLLEFGAFDEQMLAFFDDAVAAKATILVTGGTGTGKTTIVNALSEYIPDSERIITIEDAFELTLSAAHVLPLQTKEKASGDDSVDIDMAALMKSSLRMRPDRVIVGEVRDAAAANVLMTAANTGHDGTITTLHTSGVHEAVNSRLPNLMIEARGMPDRVARAEVVSAVDLIVHVTRRRKKRFISQVALIDQAGLTAEEVIPTVLWDSHLDLDTNTAVHQRVGALPPDCGLSRKMMEVGRDPERWQQAP